MDGEQVTAAGHDAVAGPRVTASDGVEIATYHYGGDGPPVLLVHATGFHGRCWAPLARRLAARYSVWSIDQRGHGASGKAPSGRYDDWAPFVTDVTTVVDTLTASAAGERWRAVGHSLGGAVVLLAEAARPGLFHSLCCYEPVVIPPGLAAGSSDQEPSLADLARRRRPTFASRQAALENFESKPPFSRFHPEVLAGYVDHGMIDLPDGSVGLACVREDEASMFEGAASNGAWDRLAEVRAPVAVLAGSAQGEMLAEAADMVARRLPRGGGRRLAGLDHFGPFTAPVEVADEVARGLELGTGRSTIGVAPPS